MELDARYAKNKNSPADQICQRVPVISQGLSSPSFEIRDQLDSIILCTAQ